MPGLKPKILVGDLHCQENPLDGPLAPGGQALPACAGIEAGSRLHKCLFQPAARGLLLGSDFSAAAPQSVKGNIAERRQKGRIVQAGKFAAAQAGMQTQAASDSAKLAFEALPRAIGQLFRKVLAIHIGLVWRSRNPIGAALPG